MLLFRPRLKVITLPRCRGRLGNSRQVSIIASILAVLHLGAVALGAMHLGAALRWLPFSRGIEFYQELSGADNTFGFFAPGVAPDTRFYIHLYDGDHWTTVFDQDRRVLEPELRLSTLRSLLLKDDIKDIAAAYWAAWAFGAYPKSRLALVEIQYFALNSLWLQMHQVGQWRRLEVFGFVNERRISESEHNP